MSLPIVAYGDPILRKSAEEIGPRYAGLQDLIDEMFRTMYASNGVGLAAPQIGESIRLFVADATPMDGTVEEDPVSLKGWRKVFINPEIIGEGDEEWSFEEGCLSIPDIREEIWRPNLIKVRWWDEKFVKHEEELDFLRGRIVQHEYDHLEGVLFVDYLSGLKRQLLRGKLSRISRGKIETKYPMRFPKTK